LIDAKRRTTAAGKIQRPSVLWNSWQRDERSGRKKCPVRGEHMHAGF